MVSALSFVLYMNKMRDYVKLVYPRSWTRGQAQLKSEYVKLIQPQEYDPYEYGNLLWDFTAIQKPSDVAGFVSHYGLLYHTEGMEKVSDFLQEASAIRLLGNLVILMMY